MFCGLGWIDLWPPYIYGLKTKINRAPLIRIPRVNKHKIIANTAKYGFTQFIYKTIYKKITLFSSNDWIAAVKSLWLRVVSSGKTQCKNCFDSFPFINSSQKAANI